MVFKLNSGTQKKKNNAAFALQNRLNTLRTRFENDEIDRQQYLKGFSFFVANEKWIFHLSIDIDLFVFCLVLMKIYCESTLIYLFICVVLDE